MERKVHRGTNESSLNKSFIEGQRNLHGTIVSSRDKGIFMERKVHQGTKESSWNERIFINERFIEEGRVHQVTKESPRKERFPEERKVLYEP